MANQLSDKIADFIFNEEALTVVEYVVAASLLVAAVTAVFFALNVGLVDKFNSSMNKV
ncbi:Flp family type IVb pilin [Vibrio superstes]|uniref:Fimbrial protein n=1 Tax=Vibrio superstes NBRC 103154 TaxID=1219062 RepID=A0A511QS42_9VIBR|nr:Flp family type IVb pilin [Vibrio superstes]GEM80153.1 hypothetical protein VSU01S_23980 [Vibrio superstes NBRC 103154]